MIRVTCAVIRNEENEILVVQKGRDTDHPLKWEFPGGKVKHGEPEDECVIREVKEELSMDIVIFGSLPDVEYDYGIKQVRLIPFVCDTLDDLPFLSEHVAYKWMNPGELMSVDFSEADVYVADQYLQRFNKEGSEIQLQKNEHPQASVDDNELQAMINRMLSMKEVNWVAVSAVENPAILNKLIEYSYSDDCKLAFHASWILSKTSDKFPGITDPFLPRMVESLDRIPSESTIRSFLRILSLSDMSKLSGRHQGLLAEFCFKSLNSGFSAIAVKAYSIEILYRLTVIYHDMVPELVASLNKALEYKSAGITSRARTILKKLDALAP